MTPRLTVAGLHHAFAGPFDLSLAAGDCLAVTGPSGAGKSLLLRSIADLDPNEGQVTLDGIDRSAMSAPRWRAKVGYAQADAGWWSETVADHFADLDAARVLATRLALAPKLLDGDVRTLSTGEKQRLALVRTLLGNPPVLLLDEPTGPLDPDSTAAVEAVLAERLAAGCAMILVTHSAEQAARLATARARMEAGRLNFA